MDQHLLIDGVDAASKRSVDAAVSKIMAYHGQVDILVNSVGGLRVGTLLHETPIETMKFLKDLNARTTFLSSRVAVPHMLNAGRGKVINIGARQALKGSAESGAYAVSKSAVLRLTESLSAELKREGSSANAVLPGTIDAPEKRTAKPDAGYARWVTPQAISEVTLFPTLDSASTVHGALIPVTGSG